MFSTDIAVLPFEANAEPLLSQEVSGVRPIKPLTLVVFGCVFLLALIAGLPGHRTFDYSILHFLNRPARQSWLLDSTMGNLDRYMFSIVPIMAMVWYEWFKSEDRGRRAVIFAGVILSLAFGGFSRCLQLALHTHPRPDIDPALHFSVPYGVTPEALSRWSSFPSDHVAVWFGLATTVFLMNRRLGRWAYGIAFTASLGRVYAGLHCPTDAIGGAMLGIFAGAVALRVRSVAYTQGLLRLQRIKKPLLYAGCLYICFGVMTLFDDYRAVASEWHAAAVNLVHVARHHHPGDDVRLSKTSDQRRA